MRVRSDLKKERPTWQKAVSVFLFLCMKVFQKINKFYSIFFFLYSNGVI